MKRILVSLYDKKAEAFHDCYPVPTKGLAIRGFSDAIAKGNSMLADHPEDFTLFQVGEFDLVTGLITRIDPLAICYGTDFMNKSNEE